MNPSVICCESFCYLLRILLLSIANPSPILNPCPIQLLFLTATVIVPWLCLHLPLKIRRRFYPKPPASFVSLGRSFSLPSPLLCLLHSVAVFLWQEVGGEVIDRIEGALIDTIRSLVLKMAEGTFRPMLLKVGTLLPLWRF